MLKKLLAIVALSGFFAAPVVNAQDEDTLDRHGRSAVGSWVVTGTIDGDVTPSFVNLATINPFGTVTTSDPVFGSGNGVWRRSGRRSFSAKFITLVPLTVTDFPPGSTVTVTGTIRLARNGRTASGPFETVFAHPDIGVLFSTTGIVDFERITLNP